MLPPNHPNNPNNPRNPSHPSSAGTSLSEAQIDEQIRLRLAQLKANAHNSATHANHEHLFVGSNTAQTDRDDGAYPLTFTGSGSEYFRIWIVNLLLIIVTLTLYRPWAKVRKMQYFYRNTHLDGASFDYHAQPIVLLKGHLVSLILLGAYYASSSFGLVPFMIFGAAALAVAPWLFWQSLRFRLANTSYRAIRFGFTGALKPAYWVFGSIIAYGLLYLGASAVMVDGIGGDANADHGTQYDLMVGGLLTILMIAPLLFPLWQSKLTHYQHSNYSWASIRSSFWANTKDFYSLWIKYAAGLLGFAIAIGLIGTALIWAGKKMTHIPDADLSWGLVYSLSAAAGVSILFALIAYVAFFAFMTTYIKVGLQNLVWSNTRTPVPSHTVTQVKVLSQLAFKPLVWLTVKNWVLSALTLGLYWPFAVVNLTKMKLEAVTIHSTTPLSHVAAGAINDMGGNALGDAVGDAFGIDIAL